MEQLLKHDWKFCKTDNADAMQPEFDDSEWRVVSVPHDYAIEGPFSSENDKQVNEVIADGILKPIVHVGRTGGLPITDPAWYRKTFDVPLSIKKVFIEFDGIMSNSVIYVNGKKCGGRIYGYSSFSVDATEAVKKGEENLLAVCVRPEPSSSRWYPGAGIYRNVRLVFKENEHFEYHSVFIRTEVRNKKAVIDIDCEISEQDTPYELIYTIYDKENKEVLTESKIFSTQKAYMVMELSNFTYWNIHDAYLYTMQITLKKDGRIYDVNRTRFGIRTILFTSDKGFFLNGKKVKIQGVCMHHDLGAIGTAFNKAAARRQIEKLIEIGVNGYRFSHNPPDPQLLDLCDEYGIVAMDEAFDAWEISKVQNDYSKHFQTEAERDLTDMIRRDRNHPCIIMWSVGNEILEQGSKDGWKVTRFLHQICKREDPTRPTTAGFSMTLDAFKNGLAREVDLAGINYKPHLYEQLHRDYPDAVLFGSETGSTVSSRGVFLLPAEIEHPVKEKPGLEESSYDLASPNWAYPIEREFKKQREYDYVCGQFVWTGFDYLGEPTPYRNSWPARSSYFGIFDLAGMEKDRAYCFMSEWTDKDVLHLMPHWNWEEGQLVDVHVYSSFDEVELFLNGKSLGIQKKDPEDEIKGYRHIWKDVKFESGELKAVAVNKPEVFDIRTTAGMPAAIVIEPERKEISADGDDLCYIKCSIVDENGVVCPKAAEHLTFSVIGAGTYVASDNGNPACDRTFSESWCDTFSGKCMVIVRSLEGIMGEIKVMVSHNKLETVTAVIQAV